MAILKLCSWHGCTKIIKEDKKFCSYHDKKDSAEQRERYKEYKRRRSHNDEVKRFQSFYNSDAWRRIRELGIKDTLAIDVVDFYKFNRIRQGERVHHIIELNDDFGKALDRNNLIYLTEKNHRIVHREYINGNKAKMQELLLDLKLRFMEEFNL